MADSRQNWMIRGAMAGLAAMGLAACQTVKPQEDEFLSLELISMYRTEGDARAVAAGHPGIVPMGLTVESELVVLGRTSCDSTAAKVRGKDGAIGWAVVATLSDKGSCPLPP